MVPCQYFTRLFGVLVDFCHHGRATLCWKILLSKFFSTEISGQKLFQQIIKLQCVDKDGIKWGHESVGNLSGCEGNNHFWQKSQMSFDDVIESYVSLLQVSTFKGWIAIISDAVDSRVCFASIRVVLK